MLLSCNASDTFVPLVYDATDAEHDQRNADKVQEQWLFVLRAEDREPAPVCIMARWYEMMDMEKITKASMISRGAIFSNLERRKCL